MANIQTIAFPSDLRQSAANRYGDQFMAIYVNVDKNNAPNGTSGDYSIVDVNGNKLDTVASSRTVLQYKSSQQNVGIPSTIIDQSLRITTQGIFLPIPLSLNTNFGVKYTDISLGQELAGAAGAVGSALGKATSGISSGIAAKFPGAASKYGGKLAFAKGIVGGVGAAAAAATPIIGFKNRASLNPHKELLFESPTFRSFKFEWSLIAKNKIESDNIANIVKIMRYYMHPKLKAGPLLYEYPGDFDIQFFKIVGGKAVPNKYLSFFATSVLTNLTVDYSGGGEYTSFDGSFAPVEVKLVCDFQETVMITQDFLDTIKENPGGSLE